MARVLVVDDEPDMLMSLRQGLEAAGHDVVLASDGRMALARVEEQAVDAVVLDLLMPVLDGLEVLEELRRRADPTAVVVLLAGPESVEQAHRALDLGAVGFQTKPFDVEALSAALVDVLQLGTDAEREAHRSLARRALDDVS